MLEDNRVDRRDIYQRKYEEKSGNASPEQELVVVDGRENRKDLGRAAIWALVSSEVHIEQRCIHVLDLPSCDEEGVAEECKGCGSGPEYHVASFVIVLVAFPSEVAGANAVDDRYKGRQTQ